MKARFALILLGILSVSLNGQSQTAKIPTEQAAFSVSVADLLAPLIKQVFESEDPKNVIKAQPELIEVAQIINEQPIPQETNAKQLLIISKRVCSITSKTIAETNTAMARYGQNSNRGSTAFGNNDDYFAEFAVKRWKQTMTQLRGEVMPLWNQIPRFEPGLSQPLIASSGQKAAQQIMIAREDRKKAAALLAATVEINGKVIQVLDSGLLISTEWVGETIILRLRNHPDAEHLVDGSRINCRALQDAKPFRYTNISGAEATVRSYSYVSIR